MLKGNRREIITACKQQIEWCEVYLKEKATAKSSAFNKALELPKEEWGLHVNDSTNFGDMIRARMKGEDIDTPEWHIKCLYDCEFDFEEYKGIGVGDGILQMACIVLNLLGEEELAQRALAAQYNPD